MSCEICGRSGCCKSFHSVEEQEDFDNIADNIKDMLVNKITNGINRLDCFYGDENLNHDTIYVKLSDVEKTIEDSY